MQTTAIAVSIRDAFSNGNNASADQFKSVNLKDVYNNLGVKMAFTDWAKSKITSYALQDGVDYTHVKTQKTPGAKPQSEYYVSLDVAKRIAVESNTAKGEELRRYLTAFEEKAAPTMPQEFMDALRASMSGQEELKGVFSQIIDTVRSNSEAAGMIVDVASKLENKLESLIPDVAAYKLLSEAEEGSVCLTDASKLLDMSRADLISWMLTNKWILRRSGTKRLIAYQTKISSGCLQQVIQPFTVGEGDKKKTVGKTSVMVTPKGLTILAKAI